MTIGTRPGRPPVLTDGELLLRGWAASDADATWQACQDPDLQHRLPVPVPYLVADATDLVTDFATAQ